MKQIINNASLLYLAEDGLDVGRDEGELLTLFFRHVARLIDLCRYLAEECHEPVRDAGDDGVRLGLSQFLK